MAFAHGKQALLAFHHVHKAHRHTDNQRRAQAVFNFLGNRQQGGGGVAHSQHGAGVFGRSLVHGGDRAGGARLFGRCGHRGVRHKAECLPAQLGQARLGDACQGHVGIGDDGCPGVHSSNTGSYRAGGKVQGLRIVKIRRGVDDPLDHRGVLRRDVQPALGQFTRDNFHAGAFNIGRQVVLRHHWSFPLSAGCAKPMAAYTAARSRLWRTPSASRSSCWVRYSCMEIGAAAAGSMPLRRQR